MLHHRTCLSIIFWFGTLYGADRQLFVDDFIIRSTSHLRRTIHPVQKYADNPVLAPTKPWEGQYALLYGTVLRDEEEGIWKAWYSTMHHFRYIRHLYPESTYLCYATSRDGIHWDKPALGVISYRGSTENNIVMEADELPGEQISGILDTVSVIKDPRDADRGRRYKMMIWHNNDRRVNGKWEKNVEPPYPMGYYIAFSPDGIHWKTNPTPVFTYNPVRDTMNTMWDPRSERYIAFVKQQVDGKRARFLSESADFLNWSKPAPMLAADARDGPDTELYNNTGFPYQGMYLGLMTVFHPKPLNNIYLDVQLISSRDGRKWERVGDRTPIIPAGRRNIDWDFGFQSPGSGAPVQAGDELWIYYSGRSYRHPVDGQEREPNHGAIGLAKLRLDGFVSMDAGDQEGVLETKPLRVEGSSLFINGDASKGEVKVELVTDTGAAMAGFTKQDSIAMKRNAVTAQMAWRGAADLPRGRSVRLRFYLRNASLYSFGFDGQRPAAVPTTLSAATHPDFLLNQRTADPLAARFPWYPKPLYYGGTGPLDADWVWPDLALADWNRDGLLDVVCGLSAGTYSHRPRDQRYRTLVFLNTGKRKHNVPVFAEATQVDLEYPTGSMFFDDMDGDGAMDLVMQAGKIFRWYRDASTSGSRRFVYQGNLQDFGLHKDLELLESVSMAPSIQLIDWDGDGRKDLIVGGRGGNNNYYPKLEVGFGKGFASDGAWTGGDRNGSVVVHKNLGMRDGKPCFSTGNRLIAGDDERAISLYDTATAAATDWNGDGKLDLVVASFDNLFVYLREGAKLAAGRRIPVAGGARLPWERVQIMEANWSTTDRHNLILQGSSFPWYLPNTGTASAPRFDSIRTLLQQHAPVSAGDFAVPAAGDLNGDGKPDLVIGNEDGYLLYVENKGGDRFAPAVELRAGGEIFRVETAKALQGPAEGRWGYTSPVLTDWDGDGDLDLIAGSSHDWFLYLENTGSKRAAKFAAPRKLMLGGKPLATVWRTRPAIGTNEMFALDTEGMLTRYGRLPNGGLQPGERILDEKGAPIKLDGAGRETGRATLTLMDWDGDGKPDLLVSNAIESFDGLRWYKNVGSNGRWVMARQANLALNLPWNHYQLLEPVDWDGDGKTDLIAGSEGGWIYFYKNGSH